MHLIFYLINYEIKDLDLVLNVRLVDDTFIKLKKFQSNSTFKKLRQNINLLRNLTTHLGEQINLIHRRNTNMS